MIWWPSVCALTSICNLTWNSCLTLRRCLFFDGSRLVPLANSTDRDIYLRFHLTPREAGAIDDNYPGQYVPSDRLVGRFYRCSCQKPGHPPFVDRHGTWGMLKLLPGGVREPDCEICSTSLGR